MGTGVVRSGQVVNMGGGVVGRSHEQSTLNQKSQDNFCGWKLSHGRQAFDSQVPSVHTKYF